MTRSWFAPAKLNLYLHVLGRRADGFHLLDSLVAFADIGDEIRAVPADCLSLTLAGPFAAELGAVQRATQENLVWRAATALAAALGRPPGAALWLYKALPIASGIGGGSSDAAATLRALSDLWQARLAPVELQQLALRLGADVPVCLFGRSAWLGGVGDELEPAPPLPPCAVLLANPGRALPTGAVFAGWRGAPSSPARFAAVGKTSAALAVLVATRRNDLTEAAIALVPEIRRVLDRLAALEGALIARMSGSGATCFALFAAAEAAEAAARRLSREEPGWWIGAGRLL